MRAVDERRGAVGSQEGFASRGQFRGHRLEMRGQRAEFDEAAGREKLD